ncbi:MAG TPA: arylsulfatase [Sedimentisphaerales bacterium]|nr:arylsulfatase [Sedimentisphaerales bacterium]
MHRREFLRTMGLSVAALAVPGCSSLLAAPAQDPRRLPNIVFIMADDMGYGDVGCYNPQSRIPTPNMDKLAAQGVRFTDAHSPSAVCSPTRYGVLTGRYCWRTRLKSGVLDGFSQPLISKDQMTVAELLKRHGYNTACIGKWHLGVGWQSKDGMAITNSKDADRVDFTKPVTDGPNEHGFDYSFITAACSTVDSPYVFIENGKCTAQPTETMVKKDSVTVFGSRPGPMVPGWSNEDVDPTYVEKTKQFLKQHQNSRKDSPFFIYLPLSAPHAPWLPPDFVKGRSSEGPRGDLVLLVDWCVGQVVDTLKHMGLADNTLLIVTSDNGPRIGDKGHKSAGPWRGYKSHTWEGGHRMPFIARWPGRIAPGSTCDELICLMDLMATSAAIVGTELPDNAAQDSYNVLPLLLGERPDKPIRNSLVSHSSKGVFAIRQGPWKLILETKGSGGWVDPRDSHAVPGSPGQLYNLAQDPYEQNDLWDKHSEIVERLAKLLQKYKEQGYSRPLKSKKA